MIYKRDKFILSHKVNPLEHTLCRQIIFGATTLDWLVFLSLAKKIFAIGPNGRKRSMRSDSLVSSDRFVTRIVAVSSEWRVQ